MESQYHHAPPPDGAESPLPPFRRPLLLFALYAHPPCPTPSFFSTRESSLERIIDRRTERRRNNISLTNSGDATVEEIVIALR